MRDRYRHRRKRISRGRMILIVVAAIVGYAALLLAIDVVGNHLEKRDVPETVGSLDGRFESDAPTVEYNGRKWTYREHDMTNILFIGVDWNENDGNESQRYDGQADFLLLLSLDRENKTAFMLQLDRDTMADIRIYGPFGDYTGTQNAQICLSHAYGDTPEENCENTVWAVSKLLGGIPIDGYIALNMDGIPALNDALGGITVTLDEDFTKSDPAMTRGTTLTLHGMQAEYYVRGRRNVGDGTNASRMVRQRTFITAAEDLIIQGMNDDMNYAGSVFDALSDYMTTNIERGWLINKAYESRNYERLETQTPVGEHIVGDDGFMEFHADSDALLSLVIQNYFE